MVKYRIFVFPHILTEIYDNMFLSIILINSHTVMTPGMNM